jgi:hypothetical protein
MVLCIMDVLLVRYLVIIKWCRYLARVYGPLLGIPPNTTGLYDYQPFTMKDCIFTNKVGGMQMGVLPLHTLRLSPIFQLSLVSILTSLVVHKFC